jgi:MFS family permease
MSPETKLAPVGVNRNLRLFMINNFIFAFSFHLWLNLRPLYLDQLGATPVQIGTALAVVSMVGCVLSVPGGWLTDRIGAKKVITVSQFISITGLVIMAGAPSWQIATVGLVASMLWVISNPAMMIYVLSNTPGQSARSERLLGIAFGPWWVATIFAPGLGGFIAERLSIRADLWLGMVGLFICTAVMAFAEDTRQEIIAPHQPVIALLRNRTFITKLVYLSGVYVVLLVGKALAPNYLQDTRGFTTNIIGLLFSISSVGTLVVNRFIGRSSNPRQGFSLLMASAWIGFAGLLLFGNPFPLGAAFLFMGSVSSSWIVVNAIVVRSVDPQAQSMAVGFIETARYLATALSSWLAGVVYGLTPAHELPIIIALGGIPLMLILSLLTAFSHRPEQQAPVC